MKYLLALDQGTTSSRALVVDTDGNVLGMSQQPFKQYFPKNGWIEHDPIDILNSQIQVAEEAVARARISTNEIAGIGITNQRETSILWERYSGKPIGRAIVWQDRRTASLCDQLIETGVEQEINDRTGLFLDPYFSASKIHWSLENDKNLKEKANKGEIAWGTVDSWLVWNLTEGRQHVTDSTNASRTLLYNIHDLEWDHFLLGLWGIPWEILPEVVDSRGVVGTTNFLGPSVPIASIVGDQQASLIGQGWGKAGTTKCTYGTGCFLLMNTGEKPVKSRKRLLTTIASTVDGKAEYALEGSVFMGGAVFDWLKDNLDLINAIGDVEKLALEVPDNGGVVMVPGFTGLGAPHWDANATGLLIGLTRGTKKGHIARAAIEAIAWQVTDLVDCMLEDSGLTLQTIKVDGGAARNKLLMQSQADYLGVPLEVSANVETTAIGAAILAGNALGFCERAHTDQFLENKFFRYQPTAKARRASFDSDRRLWREALKRSQNWLKQETNN